MQIEIKKKSSFKKENHQEVSDARFGVQPNNKTIEEETCLKHHAEKDRERTKDNSQYTINNK